ncbi:MAG: siroheme synthase CysG [Granulosicoccus sp.]
MNSKRHFDQSYPAFLDLRDRRVLVVGGGSIAARKITRLTGSGASVCIVARQLTQSLEALCLQQGYSHLTRALDDSDFDRVNFVFAASDDPEENQDTAKRAHRANCFVNVANVPSASSFLVPSLIDRKPLLVAVSSTGASPVLARILTARIDAFLPHTYSELGKLAIRYKERIARHIPDWRQRRRFWERLLSGRVGELILQGRNDTANIEMESALQGHDTPKHQGEVYLVGAGPGDPDLLSFRALRLMQQCDVVLYDRLVSDAIMALVSKSAQRIYVGKQRHIHAVPQTSINAQLAELAQQGKRVLRLKGGDPFMFGRGGEEIETLAAEGVDFQVVPGITAATGCSSYAGIPLTHRDYAQACLFVTGHLKDNSVNLDWQALVRPHQTVVIYMGLVGLPVICEQLIAHGLPEKHPIALIAQGTRANQQVITGTLKCLPSHVSKVEIKPPTLIIVGEVVSLRDKLAWFESRR